MTDFSTLLQQGAGNAWLFFPSAILLGALHGLEPGHSKTMMAAFIVAIRGTVGQAVLLGLAATVSHTAVVWLVALGGLYLGRGWDAETTEPYFQLGSALLIAGVALWMLWRTWKDQRAATDAAHDHDHGHDHGHDERRRIDTGHGAIVLEIFEDGVPPVFRVRPDGAGHAWRADEVVVETERADGTRQRFGFVAREGFLESDQPIPEPHEFVARVSLGHAGHVHDYGVEFTEAGHAHVHAEDQGLDVSAPGWQDAHERAHANDIRRRFSSRQVTTGQIAVFGLTGGLIPCPAAITVLLLCLQLKELALGAGLVLGFSVGLALTLVLSGVVAAVGMRHASARWAGIGRLASKAPYLSGGLILIVALYVGWHGWAGLMARA
jgi:nickel/cobalt transporter (NicO) family protein